MKISFPSFANECIRKIESNGFEAYFVGGCVRDALLGIPFFDIDITTNALPQDIERIFEKTIPTGLKHGTVTVVLNKNFIEVTTYRSEKGYDDNRHPSGVVFEKTIDSDLSRRDFTINALAYNPKGTLIDFFGGINDLNNRTIKCIGNPVERFSEDALRIIRAYRFASTHGFSIEFETKKASYLVGNKLQNVSAERVLSELKKLSLGENPNIISDFINDGYLSHFGLDRSDRNLNDILQVDEDFRTAMFLYLTSSNIEHLKNKLKLNNKLLSEILLINEIKDNPVPTDKISLKQQLSLLRYNNEKLYLSAVKLLCSIDDYKMIKELYNEIKINKEPYLISELAINGNDIKVLGINGSCIGSILNELLTKVIENPDLNNKDTLIEISKKIM